MDRLTKRLDKNKFYIIDDIKIQHDTAGYFGDVVNKLGKCENFYEDLMEKQNQLTKELEKLKLEDKTHSVKFKQLLANKMVNSNILILLKTYGLE